MSLENSSGTRRWKRYPKYKDSGVEWLGEVPEGWNVKHLKYLSNEPLKYGSNESSVSNDRNFPRYVRITDINSNGSLRQDTFQSLCDEIARNFILKTGDLLFARSGATVGKTFIYDNSWGRCCFAGYLVRFRSDKKIFLPRFLNFFTNSQNYWDWISNVNIQSTIQNVSGEKYKNLSVPVPPLIEQTKITIFLDHETAYIDTLISKKEQQIELLREKRMSLISHTITKGLDPNAKMKDSGVEWIGEVPEQWTVKKISYVKNYSKYSISMGPFGSDIKTDNFVISGIPLIQGNNLTGLFVRDDNIVFITKEKADELIFANAYPLDIVLTHRGTIGQVSIIPENSNFPRYVVSQSQMKVTFDFSVIYPYFINYYLNSKNGQYSLLLRKAQTGIPAIGQPVTTLKSILIPIPPKIDQKNITIFLEKENLFIDDLIDKIHNSIALLREYRTALISAAVTGKIDVRQEISA